MHDTDTAAGARIKQLEAKLFGDPRPNRLQEAAIVAEIGYADAVTNLAREARRVADRMTDLARKLEDPELFQAHGFYRPNSLGELQSSDVNRLCAVIDERRIRAELLADLATVKS